MDNVDGSRKRDRAIERLLRQSRPSHGVPRDGGATDSCLDAEMLAAWADGGLSGAALEDARSHVADCVRCQTFVGTLARISGPAQPERATRPWMWSASLKWLVPLTAAAAAVALWVAVPRDKAGLFDRPATLDGSPAPQVQGQAAETKTPEPAQLDSRLQAPSGKSENARQVPTVAPGQERSSVATSDVAQNNVARDDLARRLEAENLNEGRPPASVAAPAAAAAPAVPAERSGALARSAARAAAVAGVARIEIVSPDPSVRWRIAGSVVERSTNGASTWEAVPTGIAGELTAGAAPGASVCWLVGRGGVVLLSIDGRNWRRVAFPEMTDLSAVRATDARTASVSTADGRTFSTSDGGITWARSPL